MQIEQGETGGVTAVLNAHATLALDAVCDVGGAHALRERLAQLLSSADPITFDGSSVERIDTATLQLLFAFRRDLTERGQTMSWTAVSPAFLKLAATTGLANGLGITEHG